MDQKQFESFAKEMILDVKNAATESAARLQQKYQLDEETYRAAVDKALSTVGELIIARLLV